MILNSFEEYRIIGKTENGRFYRISKYSGTLSWGVGLYLGKLEIVSD